MKKLGLFAIILICPLLFFGCQGKSELKDNISEITKIYYQGIDKNNENVKSSISIGQRENPYIIDGIHQSNCDFSLFVVNFNLVFDNDELQVKIIINDQENTLTMYYNPVNGSYMADLGYALKEDDNISLSYQDYKIDYSNISKDFEVDYNKAIDIASQTLSKDIKEIINSSNFPGECYLKILTRQDGNFDKLFWYFNIVTQDGNDYEVVISVEDGNDVITN